MFVENKWKDPGLQQTVTPDEDYQFELDHTTKRERMSVPGDENIK